MLYSSDYKEVQQPDNFLTEVDTFDRVENAKRVLSSIDGINHKVGLVRMWPDQAVAEHENIERLRAGFRLLGIETVEVDRYGVLINSPGQKVTDADVDFIIHLHFETSKTYNVTSVAALWNPTKFYYDWGFDRFWGNQITHDVFAYTGSHEIASLLRATRGIDEKQLPKLNHTLAEPIYSPKSHAAYRVFYCGINWEVISGKSGRHDVVLRALDDTGILDIYGPKTLQGKEVWSGYKGYKHPLPFDGRTIIQKIAEAGACLVFSSEAHIDSNVMSNRLFEALAAGAVVIGDEHPFIREAVGDNYICVPSSLSHQERVAAIVRSLDHFSRNPEEGVRMAKAAQDAFLEKYFLCDQLVDVYSAAMAHKASSRTIKEKNKENIIDVIMQPIAAEADSIIGRCKKISEDMGACGKLILIVSAKEEKWYNDMVGRWATIVVNTRDRTILNPFQCLALVDKYLSAKKAIFSLGIEDLFVDTMLTVCAEAGDKGAVRLSHVLKHVDANQDTHFDGRPGGQALEQFHDAAVSAAIFDQKWLRTKVQSSSLTWKDICKIAEIEDSGVVQALGTVTTINLREYEGAVKRGWKHQGSSTDVYQLLKTATSVKSVVGEGIVESRLNEKDEHVRYRNLSGALISQEIKSLDPVERWGLTLSLYKSVPIPNWVRGSITVFRKIIGVQ